MDFRLLGPLEVFAARAAAARGGQAAGAAGDAAPEREPHGLARALVDDLWGENVPESAQKMVQIHVSQLRKVLPEPRCTRAARLRARGRRRRARPRPLRALVAEAGSARGGRRPSRRASCSRRARAVARARAGGVLGAVRPPRGRPSRGAAAGRARVADRGRSRARPSRDVVGELEALVAAHPLRERLRSQQMLALYRSGRHAEALASYQAFRRTLDEELGIEPSAGLKDLERRMLQQDPALELRRL